MEISQSSVEGDDYSLASRTINHRDPSEIFNFGKDRSGYKKKLSSSVVYSKLENIKKVLREFSQKLKSIESSLKQHSDAIEIMNKENRQEDILTRI